MGDPETTVVVAGAVPDDFDVEVEVAVGCVRLGGFAVDEGDCPFRQEASLELATVSTSDAPPTLP